jgi:hypothetical protein
MNLKIKGITYTNSDASKFWKTAEGFIRGNNIASISFPEDLIDKIEQEKESKLSEMTRILRLII